MLTLFNILFKETPPITPVTPPPPIRRPVEGIDSQQEKEVKEVICIDDSDSKDAVSHLQPQNAAPSHSHR